MEAPLTSVLSKNLGLIEVTDRHSSYKKIKNFRWEIDKNVRSDGREQWENESYKDNSRALPK